RPATGSTPISRRRYQIRYCRRVDTRASLEIRQNLVAALLTSSDQKDCLEAVSVACPAVQVFEKKSRRSPWLRAYSEVSSIAQKLDKAESSKTSNLRRRFSKPCT